LNDEAILDWLAEIFEEPAGRLSAQTPRDQIAAWDSLGSLTLIAAFDERFDLRLTEPDIRAMKCLGDVLAFLRRNGKLAVAPA
jgi:acyl carrier protein